MALRAPALRLPAQFAYRSIAPQLRFDSIVTARQSSTPSTRQSPSAAPGHAAQCPSGRGFTSSARSLKKAGKKNLSHARSDSSPPVKDAGFSTKTDEAFDLAPLESKILKAMERLTHDLAELRGGGRLSPQTVEELRVQLGKGTAKETVRIKDLAQVVPRGRMISVIAGDADHIKPITAAIHASPHSLTPQAPDPSSPLTIPIPLPPPTGESRKAALDAAKKAGDTAHTAVQDARAEHHKKIRKFQVDGSVRPDDLHKATKAMEEVVKKGNGEVTRIVDGARKVLESSS